jgi:hypothetical protein
MFYPYHNTLAYSDVFFTSTVIGLLPYVITKEPGVFFAVNLLFSLITLGFFTYLLLYMETRNYAASITAGFLVSFSTFTLSRLPVLQLISIQWIPLSLLFFLLYLKKQRFRDLILTAVFFLIQVYNSFLPGYFLVFCYICIAGGYLFRRNIAWSTIINRRFLSVWTITFLLVLPLAIPYVQVSREFGYVRDIRDTIHFANRPQYTFYPGNETRLEQVLIHTIYGQPNTTRYGYEGYLGLVLLLLTGFVVYYRFMRHKKGLPLPFLPFSLIAADSFVLSLGPAWQWGEHVVRIPFPIPLPYALFYYLVPGFQGFRNSARWEMLTVFGLAVVIGLTLAHVFSTISFRKQMACAGIICFAVLAEFSFPLQYAVMPKRSSFPPVYSYVNTLPQSTVIIELPLYNWNMQPFASAEFMRLYYGTSHFRRSVNGFSGFFPPPWEEQARELLYFFPEHGTLKKLKQQGVSVFILHLSDYDAMARAGYTFEGKQAKTGEAVIADLSHRSDITFVKRFGSDYVYQLR